MCSPSARLSRACLLGLSIKPSLVWLCMGLDASLQGQSHSWPRDPPSNHDPLCLVPFLQLIIYFNHIYDRLGWGKSLGTHPSKYVTWRLELEDHHGCIVCLPQGNHTLTKFKEMRRVLTKKRDIIIIPNTRVSRKYNAHVSYTSVISLIS